jgi:hypothetical protein
VFLVSRILEYRLEGHTDRSALVRGVVSTGHIISMAGVLPLTMHLTHFLMLLSLAFSQS